MSCDWEDNEYLDFKELEEQITQIVDNGNLEEMLRIQLSELEMLQSMFSNPGEFCIDDPSVIADINEFLDGKTNAYPPRLDFAINITIDKAKFEVCVNLPHDYPATEPDIFVRSDKLTRSQQHELNCDLSRHLNSLDRGEICICTAIQWLQENATCYLTEPKPEPVINRPSSDDEERLFTRYWIYSHHIYSKVKRREILDLAHEFNVTGFCLPGRPGIICAEGIARDCAEWWQKVKSMNWKKIMCKKREVKTLEAASEAAQLRKFPRFQEVAFETERTSGKSRDCHMDMGQFFLYLEKHDCSYVFKDYFGVDAKARYESACSITCLAGEALPPASALLDVSTSPTTPPSTMQSLEAACEEAEDVSTCRIGIWLQQILEIATKTPHIVPPSTISSDDSSGHFPLFHKLRELYVAEVAFQHLQPNQNFKASSYLLDKLVAREHLNTLIVNLYPDKKGYSIALRIPNKQSQATTATESPASGQSASTSSVGGTPAAPASPATPPSVASSVTATTTTTTSSATTTTPSSAVAATSATSTPTSGPSASASNSPANQASEMLIETVRWPYSEDELLRCVDNEELPPFLLQLLEESQADIFYEGCIIAEVRDYRNAYPHTSFSTHHVLLRPTNQSLVTDLRMLTSQGDWTYEEKLALESQLLLATQGPLCLDPSPAVAIAATRLRYSAQPLNTEPIRRCARRYSQVAINRKRKLDQFSANPHLPLHDFLSRRRARLRTLNPAATATSTSAGAAAGAAATTASSPAASTSTAVPASKLLKKPGENGPVLPAPPPVPMDLMPDNLTPPSTGVADVLRLARPLERPPETNDCAPRLVEEYILETDREQGRVYHVKLSILQRPSNSEFLGELYLDRDYREGQRNGSSCRFTLGTRAHANQYIQQFREIFTDEGRKSVRITHLVPGQPPRVRCTPRMLERDAKHQAQLQAQAAQHAAAQQAAAQQAAVQQVSTQQISVQQSPAQVNQVQQIQVQQVQVQQVQQVQQVLSGQPVQVHVQQTGQQSPMSTATVLQTVHQNHVSVQQQLQAAPQQSAQVFNVLSPPTASAVSIQSLSPVASSTVVPTTVLANGSLGPVVLPNCLPHNGPVTASSPLSQQTQQLQQPQQQQLQKPQQQQQPQSTSGSPVARSKTSSSVWQAAAISAIAKGLMNSAQQYQQERAAAVAVANANSANSTNTGNVSATSIGNVSLVNNPGTSIASGISSSTSSNAAILSLLNSGPAHSVNHTTVPINAQSIQQQQQQQQLQQQQQQHLQQQLQQLQQQHQHQSIQPQPTQVQQQVSQPQINTKLVAQKVTLSNLLNSRLLNHSTSASVTSGSQQQRVPTLAAALGAPLATASNTQSQQQASQSQQVQQQGFTLSQNVGFPTSGTVKVRGVAVPGKGMSGTVTLNHSGRILNASSVAGTSSPNRRLTTVSSAGVSPSSDSNSSLGPTMPGLSALLAGSPSADNPIPGASTTASPALMERLAAATAPPTPGPAGSPGTPVNHPHTPSPKAATPSKILQSPPPTPTTPVPAGTPTPASTPTQTSVNVNVQGLSLASLQGAVASFPGLQVSIPALAVPISVSLNMAQPSNMLLISSSTPTSSVALGTAGASPTMVLANNSPVLSLPVAQLVTAGVKGLPPQQRAGSPAAGVNQLSLAQQTGGRHSIQLVGLPRSTRLAAGSLPPGSQLHPSTKQALASRGLLNSQRVKVATNSAGAGATVTLAGAGLPGNQVVTLTTQQQLQMAVQKQQQLQIQQCLAQQNPAPATNNTMLPAAVAGKHRRRSTAADPNK
ncbi:RWD domain-containing protein 2A [Gryllus bimaculatus]|nr:RWD domain-containing protein 2A [Gryllus bimaculatus]